MIRTLTRRERIGLRVLATLIVAIVMGVGAIQIVGHPLGGPCRDSYSCRGFVIGGAECIEDVGGSYCTRHCHADRECPQGWRCTDASISAAAIPLSQVGPICIQPDR